MALQVVRGLAVVSCWCPYWMATLLRERIRSMALPDYFEGSRDTLFGEMRDIPHRPVPHRLRIVIQAAQCMVAEHVDRSSQAGAALESAPGAALRSAPGARTCQSRHLAGGAQASRLSAVCGQERTTFPGTYAAKTDPNEEKSQKTSCGGLAACSRLSKVCSVSDPPAGPHALRDCARELTLPIHPIVCFEVGWFTLTQSSWTGLRLCSRKWMSGHAATALAMRSIDDSSEPKPVNRRGYLIPPSLGKSPFSLDCYLSWMSRIHDGLYQANPIKKSDDRPRKLLNVFVHPSPTYTDCEVTAMNKDQIRGWMYALGVWLCGAEVVAYYRRKSKKVLKS